MAVKHVQSGDPFSMPASVYNRFADAANAVLPSGKPSGGVPAGMAVVKNTSDTDMKRFDVIGLTEPITLPEENLQEFQTALAWKADWGDVEQHGTRMAVLAGSIPAGKFGLAWMSGVVPVRINLGGWERQHVTSCGIPFSNETTYQTGLAVPYGGTRILWCAEPEDETVEEPVAWALAQLGVFTPSWHFGRMYVDPATGSSDTWLLSGYRNVGMRVYHDHDWVNEGDATIERVWSPAMIRSGQGIHSQLSNGFVRGIATIHLDGKWYWTAADCAGS